MKRILIISILLNCLAWCGGGSVAWANQGQLKATGNWVDAGSDGLITVNANTTVNLTGNVNVYAQIQIKAGYTLTITNNSTGNLTITNQMSGAKTYLFYIESGATLIIKGAAGKQITLNGGAGFSYIAGSHQINNGVLSITPATLTTTSDKMTRAFYNRGTLTIDHVTVQHFNVNGEGAAILINSAASDAVKDANGNIVGYKTYSKNGKTTLNYTTIQLCKGTSGTAIKCSTISSEYETTKNNNDPEACWVKVENSTIQKCIAIDTETAGIIRSNGGFVGNLYLTNVTVQNNYSHSSGGGLYWNAHGRSATTCKINQCTFNSNMAAANGGAIMLESDFEFTGAQTTLSNNIAGNMGGGMVITGYGGGADTESNYNLGFNLSNFLKVNNNKSKYGGGIAFNFGPGMTLPANSTINVNANGATISENTATDNGGALYFNNTTNAERNYTININLNYGTLESNDAKLGGSIYVNKEHVKYDPNVTTTSGMTINNNYASDNGGGIYMDGGSFTMPKGTITNNRAGIDRNGNINSTEGIGYGGGVYMHNGTVNIGQGTVTGNICKLYGGGLYVYNESTADMSFSGGILKANNAYAGGGVCLSGPVSMNMTGSDIEENTATNGGGIYLRDGASLTYSSGLIRGNKAIITDGTDTGSTGTQENYNTANGATASSITGIGGGVFLDSGKNANTMTSLSFDFPNGTTRLGFYDNMAYTSADDIFSNGVNTMVNLPDVEKMDLTGFNVPTSALYWFEDYVTSDAAYESGSKVQEVSNGSHDIRRYRYSNKEVKDTYAVTDFEDVKNKYLCLHLGFQYIMATIQKSGLLPGENAVFKVCNIKDQNTEEFHANVFLKGPATAGEVVSKNIALVEGEWKIYETDWSWTYTGGAEDQSNNKYVQQTIKANQPNIFPFTNEKNVNIAKTKYGEDLEENEMKK